MTTEFKKRVNAALAHLPQRLKLHTVRSRSLYSVVWRKGKYEWISPMESDGLLVSTRQVENPMGGVTHAGIRIGVVIQTEFSTSQTKPNPFGKALIGMLPYGVWVDVEEIQEGQKGKTRARVRLDEVLVLFIVPNHTHQAKKAQGETAFQNVTNAAEASDYADVLRIEARASTQDLANAIAGKVRGLLIGKGRPKKTT